VSAGEGPGANGPRLEPYGHVGTPLFPAVTYDERAGGPYDYARSQNPTRAALEAEVARLEGAVGAFAFASGMAAITAVLLLLSPGDELLCTEDCQGGTTRVLDGLFARLGVRTRYVPTHDLDQVEKALTPACRAILVENLSNPFLRFTDVAALAARVRGRGVQVWVDNTLVTPALERPLEHGADLVLHSASKYLSGHGDVMAGVVATRDPDLARRVAWLQNATGTALSVEESWLALRGLATFPLRFAQSQASAALLAPRIASHPATAETVFPGLDSHPDHALVAAHHGGFGAIVTFRLAHPGRREAMLASLRTIAVGPGSGSTRTILGVMERHCHAPVPPDVRAARGIDAGLLRLSVGLEPPELLWSDLARALDEAGAPPLAPGKSVAPS
jgi:cystathionine beta-lyase/cystathionine gamma-synthase